MSERSTDVLVAGYQTVDSASAEFDGLIAQVQAGRITLDAAILVAHDEDGNVSVQQTGDHLGRKGAGWGGAKPSKLARATVQPATPNIKPPCYLRWSPCQLGVWQRADGPSEAGAPRTWS